MAEEKKITQETSTEEKMQELFDLMDAKAAAGELQEVDDLNLEKELNEELGPMSDSERAAFEYSMMMNQFEAMRADYERREAEERAAKKKEAEKDEACRNNSQG